MVSLDFVCTGQVIVFVVLIILILSTLSSVHLDSTSANKKQIEFQIPMFVAQAFET
jgi:hypothetical protein